MTDARTFLENVYEAQTLGARLRELRLFRELTLRRFADQVGCDPGYLSKLETGKAQNPTERFLVSVVANFRVNLQWLRTGAGDPFLDATRDEITRDALPDWSPERLSRIMSMITDLPEALASDAVLGCLFRDKTLEEVQSAWRDLRSLPGLPVTARLFWNDCFMLFQATKLDTEARKKIGLTTIAESGNLAPVKSQLKDLLADLNRLTREPGTKTKLADFLGAPLTSVSRWLSGEREPGGETALKMLRWVQEHQSQLKTLGSAINTTKGKTQVHKSSYEKQTQVRKHG